MLIGELSELTGFSRHTIRFYEKQGIFRLGRKDRRANNYKDYPEDVLKKLLVIKRLKGFGFTLNESANLLAMIEEDLASCRNVSEMVNEKIKTLDQKINELQQMKNLLVNGIEHCLHDSEPSDKQCDMIVA
jgi:MerR family transcriptional regulator, copper efflux regulator